LILLGDIFVKTSSKSSQFSVVQSQNFLLKFYPAR
jgi:hypothetical protein